MDAQPAHQQGAEIVFDDTSTLLTGHAGEIRVQRTIVVAAHPDDEVIGAASRLSRFADLTILHITDGAPRNMQDAVRHGFSTPEEYASARRMEFHAAMEVAGLSPRTIEGGIPDQEVADTLAPVVRRLADIFTEHRPDLVLTHPYEGGHPDHDACAFAVRAAVSLTGPLYIPVFEFTSYHAADGEIRTSEFLPSVEPVTTVNLTLHEQALKRRMLDCFQTQQETLALFTTATERYRAAPAYDFNNLPNHGNLYYETRDWGMNGGRFLRLIREASAALSLGARR